MGNYVQPDYRVPVNIGASIQIENVQNPLSITAPVAKYTQPGGTDKPPAPVAGQLADAMGKSKKVFADGSTSST